MGEVRINLIRKWQQHGLIFASGFAAGYINSFATNKTFPFDAQSKLGGFGNHFAISAIGYTAELSIANWARSSDFPNGWYDSGWEQKARIIGMKDLIQSLVAH